MLIVQKGYVKYRGLLFGPGQPLPDGFPKGEEKRLLDLGVCFETGAPIITPKEEVPSSELEQEKEPATVDADIDLNFDPEESIKTSNKRH